MTESPIDVWIKQAIPPGSGRYYALLHSKNPSYTSAVLTLISIWSKLCFSNKEIDASTRQIDWWQSELESDNPRHPVTQQLSNTVPDDPTRQQTIDRLNDVLEGYRALVIEGSPSRETPNRQFHHRTGAMAAVALSGPNTKNHGFANTQATGIALSRFRCIRHLHKHVANGLLCLPYEALNAHGISPKEWVPGSYTKAMLSFLQQQLTAIANELDEALSKVPAESPGNSFVYVYARLQYQLLRRVQNDIQILDQQDIRLSPLRNFWIAGKAARQHSKSGVAAA